MSDNHIAVSFEEPAGAKLALSQVLDIDLEVIGAEQRVDPTTGQSMMLNIRAEDIHDLLLPVRHGGSRFPAEMRRRGH